MGSVLCHHVVPGDWTWEGSRGGRAFTQGASHQPALRIIFYLTGNFLLSFVVVVFFFYSRKAISIGYLMAYKEFLQFL